MISGVWLDASKQLHAKGVTGTFLIEYYRDGTYISGGATAGRGSRAGIVARMSMW